MTWAPGNAAARDEIRAQPTPRRRRTPRRATVRARPSGAPAPLGVDLATRAGDRPPDDGQHDGGGREDRRQLDARSSRRAAAKTADRGRSSASVQPAAGEFAYATTRPVSSVEARGAGKHAVALPDAREKRPVLGAREARERDLLARPVDDDEPFEAEIDRALVRAGRANSIAPASTPLTRPLASRVGTAMITTRLGVASGHEPLADERLARRDDVLEVRAVRHAEPRARRVAIRDA